MEGIEEREKVESAGDSIERFNLLGTCQVSLEYMYG